MKQRSTFAFSGLGLFLGLLGPAVFSGCGSYPTCETRGNCAPGGIASGNAGSSGNSGSSGSSSGSAGESGSTDNAGTGGDAGAAGAAPCDGACSGSKPVCDVTTDTCVQCLKRVDCEGATPACDTTTSTCVECAAATDCKDAAKPFCDKDASECVACLEQADCVDATASACSVGVCAACTKDEECADIAGKGVCDAGTCVQCTVAKETVCGGKSCNPGTKACTTTALGSVTTCKPCIADSECAGGNQLDADARCVPMKFKGVSRTGGFCLRRVSKTCASPYKVVSATPSLSGAASEAYCGINEDLTRCEAVLDLVAGGACADGQDSSCGCARDMNGICIGSGQGGLCRTVGPDAKHCTYECGTTPQCPAGTVCGGSSTTYCQ